MPWFLGAVIGLSFLVLMVVFRSVLVPLKAAALNVLGVGAAYGVVVAVFQWGWGASLIGVHETVPIMPLAPMLMFAILFGLSMDYEVFLMSRVREQYLKHFDPRRAVVEGVGSTARVITSAARHHDLRLRLVHPRRRRHDQDVRDRPGVAVFLDVTLVRMVLVPAAMSLLGTAPGGCRPGSNVGCRRSTSTVTSTVRETARAPRSPSQRRPSRSRNPCWPEQARS